MIYTLQVTEEDIRNLMFGDYMNPDLEGDDRIYIEIPSIQQFNDVVDQCLDEYNQTHKSRMNLVVFRYLYFIYFFYYFIF